MALPRIAFDTSALNALAKGGSAAEPYVKALNCGFEVLLTAMSVEELLSTPEGEMREALVASSQRLLASGICVWPPHEIMTLLVRSYARNPQAFAWQSIDIRARVYERAIIDRDFTDELCTQQLIEQKQVEEDFMSFWERLRTKLDPLFAEDPGKRPTSYRQAAEIARSASPNLLWAIGKGLYKHVTGADLTDAEIDVFLSACPPLCAAVYGLCGSWYDLALAPAVFKNLAGRNDQMMSVYLPYCARFVTRDKKQLERLRDIAVEAQLDCEVVYYDSFLASFDIVS